MKFQSCIVTSGAIIVSVDGHVYNASSEHPNFLRLKAAYKNGSVEDFIEAFDVKRAIEQYVDNDTIVSNGITIVDNEVLYNDKPVNNAIVDAIQKMMTEGFDIKPMVKFLENLFKNPSFRSVRDLWKFIEAMGLTITEDGCFLAYKSVSSDYMDKYSNTINNRPGEKPVRKKRNEVDDDPAKHCSSGYHVGALQYAGPDGWYHSSDDKIVICKVNPADVVSVPNDHDGQKLRCCYYEPLSEFKGELKASVYSGEVNDDYSTPAPVTQDTMEYVDPYDLLVGTSYVGDYTSADGGTKERYFFVEDETTTGNYVVELVYPEPNDGEYRTFKPGMLNNVKNIDVGDIYW